MVLLALLTLALFGPAVRYGFINCDDDRYVLNNPPVQRGLAPGGLRWAFTTVHEQWWLPVLWTSFMADVTLFGPEPFGHHLTNVLLHVANVLLLFWVLARMTRAPWRSFFVAAFFALHPLRVESVVWITARKDVLSGLFFFRAVLVHLRQAERPAASRRAGLAALMLLGLMSKAIVVVLPALLLLLDYWPLRRAGDPWGRDAWPRWRPLLAEKWPLFALALVFSAVNLHTHVSGSGGEAGLPLATRVGLALPNYWTYLGKIFWPAHLSIHYPECDVVNGLVSAAAGLGLLAVTGLLVRFRKTAPYGLVGWLWFLFALVPVIRGVRLGLTAYADRFVYLPSIGLALALVWGAAAGVALRPRLKTPAIGLGILLLAACAARSAVRLPDWRSSYAMFSRLIQTAPDDPLANVSYGYELLLQGRFEESLPYSHRGAQHAPATSIAVLNYANALFQLGRHDELLDWLDSARARGFPNAMETRALAGLAYLGADRAPDAVPILRQCVRWKPAEPAWRVELIRALYESDQPEAAQEELQALQALGISQIRDWDGLVAYYARSWQSGHVSSAWAFFRNNLRRRPDDGALLNNAAWLLATTENPPAPPTEALRLARRAAELAPAPHPGILDTVAVALAANGRFEEATEAARGAIDLARQSGAEELARKIAARLDLYRRNQPWTESLRNNAPGAGTQPPLIRSGTGPSP